MSTARPAEPAMDFTIPDKLLDLKERTELAIIMAKNDSDPLGPAGATMFLAPMNAPGIHIERVLDTLDQYMTGGHAVVRLDGLRVHESAMLGRIGEGFRYAQVRLAPARLTHCMRWLGAACRAHDIATD